MALWALRQALIETVPQVIPFDCSVRVPPSANLGSADLFPLNLFLLYSARVLPKCTFTASSCMEQPQRALPRVLSVFSRQTARKAVWRTNFSDQASPGPAVTAALVS